MINVQLNLITPIFVPSNNKYSILSTVDYDIIYPSIDLNTNEDIDLVIKILLSRYLKEVLAISPKLTDITLDNSLSIYYVCFINYETEIINGVLKNIDENTSNCPKNAAKILSLLQ